jgi:hypothetical protein
MRGAIPSLPQYAFMAWCSVTRKEFHPTSIIVTDAFVLFRIENVCDDSAVSYFTVNRIWFYAISLFMLLQH